MSQYPNDCGNPELDFMTTIRSCIGKDSNGRPILRIIQVTDAGNFFDCNTAGSEFNWNSLIRLNEEGKPAIGVNISNLT